MSANHVSETQENKAIYHASTQYRQNGYNFIKANDKRCGAYGDLDRIRKALSVRGTTAKDKPNEGKVSSGSKAHAERYVFVYDNNFIHGDPPYKKSGTSPATSGV